MTVYFFPRDKTFWLYHGSVLLLISVFQLITILLWRKDIAFNIIGSLLWLPLLTLAALYYRWLYKHRHWHLWGMAKTLGFAVGYGLVAGFVVATVMLGLVVPLFWQDFVEHEAIVSQKVSLASAMTEMVVSNSTQTTLFICAWIFVYISVTSRRRIRESELTNLRLQNSLREAQLSHLANQLNPHFLFNALNNIRFMIHENPHNAESMVISLSDMLRYSLEGSKKEKVSLREELETIERYLALMRVQLEHRLQVQMDIPASLGNYLVPPMILQMLVENAIKHGLDNRREGGTLQLSARLIDGLLTLNVSNDIADKAGNTTKTLGIGLSNIQQRLTLLYGDSGQIHNNEDAQQFSVSVQLPGETQ